jgi:hypothetical protein
MECYAHDALLVADAALPLGDIVTAMQAQHGWLHPADAVAAIHALVARGLCWHEGQIVGLVD